MDRQPHQRNWDYKRFNYCMTCRLQYDKSILRCKECKNRIRTKPQTNMGQRDHNRL
jgi:hypothetical protein